MRNGERSARRSLVALLAIGLGVVGARCGGSANAGSSGAGYAEVRHRVTRQVIDVNASYDDFRARYEQAVPTFAPDKLAGLADWNAVGARTAELAPHGFLIYGKVDASPVMKLNGHTERAVTYLMGNHMVAETMYGKDPGVMLYAPLRTVLYADGTSKVHFAVDKPSTRFARFGNDDIAATGRKLDEKLAKLLRDLDLPVPAALS